ncbi:hypothetical protein NPIL_62011 [Nephila pilipes]|uniref:Uncharacterized protein n=1 Tax=Nephila pilipes TaxID=299642 RepID=A0A8X6T358_NEPPI|nr:hypothetical protein NPIL_62011 [Nephila pilipes]
MKDSSIVQYRLCEAVLCGQQIVEELGEICPWQPHEEVLCKNYNEINLQWILNLQRRKIETPFFVIRLSAVYVMTNRWLAKFLNSVSAISDRATKTPRPIVVMGKYHGLDDPQGCLYRGSAAIVPE